jgi:alpha-1,2-rhamnosyltransferase
VLKWLDERHGFAGSEPHRRLWIVTERLRSCFFRLSMALVVLRIVMAGNRWVPKRVFLECTRTINSAMHTGIERVVRNIITASTDIAASMNLLCVPVAFRPRHGFVPVDVELLRGVKRGELDSRSFRIKRQLERWGLIDLARAWRRQFEHYASIAQLPFQRLSKPCLQLGSEDVILLLDSSWKASYWNSVREAQRAGAVVGATVYDLLPIQLPHSTTATQRECFVDWWNRAYQEVDFITAISQSVYSEIVSYDKRQGTRSKPLVGDAFRLGADFLSGHVGVQIRPGLQELANGRESELGTPFYLCVGTLCPRKQPALVLDAFDALWARGHRVRLVYVGADGWHSGDLIARLRSHPRFGRELFWFYDLTDAELNWCYQRAAGLIAASQGEGFDLPIVEALRLKCAVLASDIPVHHEVGGAFASYFSPGSFDSLTELVEEHLHGDVPVAGLSARDFLWPNWRQSCEELMRLIIRLASECKERPCLTRDRVA